MGRVALPTPDLVLGQHIADFQRELQSKAQVPPTSMYVCIPTQDSVLTTLNHGPWLRRSSSLGLSTFLLLFLSLSFSLLPGPPGHKHSGAFRSGS